MSDWPCDRKGSRHSHAPLGPCTHLCVYLLCASCLSELVGQKLMGAGAVPWGSRAKAPHTGQPKQQVYALTFLEARIPKARCAGPWFLRRCQGRVHPAPSRFW